MENHEMYLDELLKVLIPTWEKHREDAELARDYGDMQAFREHRLCLGAVSKSSMHMLNVYKQSFGQFPSGLEQRVDSYVSQLKSEVNIR